MARANGKVILLGEHAVVHGVAAIAAGINRGATATARSAEMASVKVGSLAATSGDDSELGQALEALRAELATPPLAVDVALEIPPGSGLGASAAIGVAVARATLDATGGGRSSEVPEPAERTEQVMRAANAWERVFHGNPSGIDTSAATLGGCISFTRQQGAKRLSLGRSLQLAIAIAGPPASTRKMVESVARLKEHSPGLVGETLDGIASAVNRAEGALATGDVEKLGELLNENHELLKHLSVSTEAIELACALARDAGALGAKLTGAGGGGAVVALVQSDPEPVLSAWRNRALHCFCCTVEATREHSPATRRVV
jgi:mevalonate kinase